MIAYNEREKANRELAPYEQGQFVAAPSGVKALVLQRRIIELLDDKRFGPFFIPQLRICLIEEPEVLTVSPHDVQPWKE